MKTNIDYKAYNKFVQSINNFYQSINNINLNQVQLVKVVGYQSLTTSHKIEKTGKTEKTGYEYRIKAKIINPKNWNGVYNKLQTQLKEAKQDYPSLIAKKEPVLEHDCSFLLWIKTKAGSTITFQSYNAKSRLLANGRYVSNNLITKQQRHAFITALFSANNGKPLHGTSELDVRDVDTDSESD